MLRYIGETGEAPEADHSSVGLLDSREHAKQRRLAAAVRTDEPDSIPLLDRQRKIGEQGCGAETHRDLLTTEQQGHPAGCGNDSAACRCHDPRAHEASRGCILRMQPLDVSTPRAGLEPATIRLTAGRSTD